MDDEIRKYLRIIPQDEKKRLQNKAKQRLELRRNGFLTKDQVEKLSGLKKWERRTNRDLSKYFSEVRAKSESALLDFKILFDALTEMELERILTKTTTAELPKGKFSFTSYPITELLASLLPHPLYAEQKTQQEIEDIMTGKEWRKAFLEEMMVDGLAWYFYSGLCKTDAEKKILFDAIDMISVKSSGTKKYTLMQNGDKLDLVQF